jgi:N-acetylneuraminic acid mutarotase
MNPDPLASTRFGTHSAIAPVLALLSVAVAACSDVHSPTAADSALPTGDPVPELATAAPNTWSSRAPMPTGRSGLVVAAVNGVIYAIGGQDAAFKPLAKVEAFLPGAGTLVAWASKAPLPARRSGPDGAAVINGKIYVAGGNNDQSQATRSLFVYDVAGNYWTTKAAMPMASYGGAAAAIDGKLYVIATPPGEDQFFTAPTRLFRYDPATNTWTQRASPPHHHHGGIARAINGKLYVAGGLTLYWDDAPRVRAWAELDVYDPVTNTWTTKAPMPGARYGGSAGVINGKLYVAGRKNPLVSTLEVYDPATNTWVARAGMPTPRWGTGAGVVNGVLYVMGGTTDGSEAFRTNEAYTP